VSSASGATITFVVFATRDIAVYAATVGTIDGIWSIYGGAVLDRARISVTASEGQLVTPGVAIPNVPVMLVRVSNRGRRATSIQSVSRVVSFRRHHGIMEMSADIAQELSTPAKLAEAEGRTFVHGARGGCAPGQMPANRWFVTDGAGRTYPLRERWRQRVERIVFWPWRAVG
jgi:hypothetical protein